MKISRFGYFWLDTWVMANIIQLATQDFCRRFLNHSNDPGGRQYDQMTQAARSAPANIAEGNSRHTTSRETEMKLTDVARATLAELTNDYFNWLLQHEQLPWSVHSPEYKQVISIQLDKPTYDDDLQYQSGIHILRQKQRFDTWLKDSDSFQMARCIIVLCNRLASMLSKQIEQQLATFSEEGGFTEALTTERLTKRTQQNIEAGAPPCPLCGKPMIRRMAKKGINSGNEFWSCSDYPNCHGTRPFKRGNE
jgi:four helix bundle suffix protein